jgi:ABC-2 type transport system ATP-binding protein
MVTRRNISPKDSPDYASRPAIVCKDLKKTYPGKPVIEAVCGLNLEVNRGECFGLLGPNGAGKTTTIEILEGLLQASSGSVSVLGRSWSTDADAIRQLIGVSLQETQLSEKLTVRETLALFRSFYSTGIDIESAMQSVSLEEKRNARISQLSGGQKQRLAVATALVGDPELLFLDEPTTGLDPSSRRQLWDIIRTFREAGKTILLTTHYMDEAERLCDRVGIVDQGRVIALGTPRELIAGVGGDHVVEFSVSAGQHAFIDSQRLTQLLDVTSVRDEGDHWMLNSRRAHHTIPALLEYLDASGIGLAGLTTRQASLEDVFVKLTGRNLLEDRPS